MSSDLVLLLFTLCGTSASLLLLLAPLPAYQKAVMSNTTAGIPFEYILMSNVSQIAGAMYGVKTGNLGITVPSVVGAVVTLGYLLAYKAITGSVIRFSVCYMVTAGVSIYSSALYLDSSSLGWICLVLIILNSLAGLIQTCSAIYHHDPELIDMNITLGLLLCGFFWSGYGLLVRDVFILIPNVVCQVVAAMNISAKLVIGENSLMRQGVMWSEGVWKRYRGGKQLEGYVWV